MNDRPKLNLAVHLETHDADFNWTMALIRYFEPDSELFTKEFVYTPPSKADLKPQDEKEVALWAEYREALRGMP